MEKIEKDFEGKKRKPDSEVTNIDDLQKKGKHKRNKDKKPKPVQEGAEDKRGTYKIYELKSEKFEYYYKVRLLLK
jgi:hypothetical protein